jgi:glyoxylase-like metal-dependent hydrolase (beta-lactamase superfamily II)
VIISHWHNDHPLGVPAITARFPKARIIATAMTAADLAKPDVITTGIGKVDPERRDSRFKASEERAAEYRKSADDPALPADVRRDYAIEAAWVMERARRQLGNYVVLPTETFTDRLIIDDPEVPIEARFLGRANTRGDAFAWLPKQRVMFTGDAVVAPTPYGFTNPAAPWLATLAKLEAYPFAILVPGHGQVQRDRAYLATLRWSMADIGRQATALAATEQTAEAAYKKFDAAEQRRRFGANDAWARRWLDGYWLEGMLETAFNAAKGSGKDDKVD